MVYCNASLNDAATLCVPVWQFDRHSADVLQGNDGP